MTAIASPSRSAGVGIPLFSIRSDRGWGIGELPDIGDFAVWLEQARFRLLMLLPLSEASLGQDSPYSALSAFALDPVYVSLESMEDFQALGGDASLTAQERRDLDAARARATVDYPVVRRLKETWLRRSFERFVASGAVQGSERATDLARFREEEAGWLSDYTLFRALKETHGRVSWRHWPAALQARDPMVLAEAERALERSRAFFEYVQWIAFRQLAAARRQAGRHGVMLAGDLPFMVAEDSVDVWCRQDEFRFDCTVGVPPDAYAADGQDWGLPVYRWDRIARQGFDWLKRRGEAAAKQFDCVRVDHVVGFYRTYARPLDKSKPFFVPLDEAGQRRQGEAVIAAIRAGGAEVVAEDLGTVPPFVRKSLAAIHCPGYRVQRWEQELGRFRDPAKWPTLSLATTGTHDSETLAVWWESLPAAERLAACELTPLSKLAKIAPVRFTPEVHEALLELVYGAASTLLVIPVQDVFGARERINLPGTVSADNWSYRLPWTLAELRTDADVQKRTRAMADLAQKHGR